MRNDVHLIAVRGEPDRLLETVGRDAEALCKEEIRWAKVVGRLDIAAMRVESRTALICGKCLLLAAAEVLVRNGVTYVYGIVRAELADRMNADKEEE